MVADAETPADLAAVARTAIEAELLHAVSGSAGLARELSVLLGEARAQPPRDLPPIDRRVLAVIGSPHPVARAQVDRVGGRVVTVPAARAGTSNDLARRDAAGRLLDALRRDRFAILCPTPLEDGVPAADAAVMAATLAATARALVRSRAGAGEEPVQAIVVSGGDVAAALCERLRTAYIELIDQVFPGAPLGVLHGGFGEGLPIVTKSGAHGDEDGLLRVVARLRNGVDRAAERTSGSAAWE